MVMRAERGGKMAAVVWLGDWAMTSRGRKFSAPYFYY
jgi:hypothetical protein